MFKHILIPIDEDAGSRRSIKQGVTLAQAAGARVTGFPAVTESNHAGIVDELLEPPPEELQLPAYAHAGQLFATLVDEAECAGVACTTLAGPSETPWEAIVAAAMSTHSDPVVMASTWAARHRAAGARPPDAAGIEPRGHARAGGAWQRAGVITP